MPLFFDSVQQASWAGFVFPVRQISILGKARLHQHKYAHQDGANLEPLGRDPYIIRMRMVFDEGDEFYPGMYPDRLNDLRFIAESGTSSKLVVPNVGTINAFCPTWAQTWDVMVARSGEHADYEWIEDQSAQLKQVFFTGISSTATMTQKTTDLAKFKDTGTSLGVDPSLFDKVINAAYDVVAIRDRADLTATMAADKIASLSNWLGALDDALTSPIGYQIIDACRALWQTLFDFESNVQNLIAPPSTWTVPGLMTIADVSRNIYGDTEHQVDLLTWNAVDDAFAIPAGTLIKYSPLSLIAA